LSRDIDRDGRVMRGQGRLLPGESVCSPSIFYAFFPIYPLSHLVARTGAPSLGTP